MTRFGQTLYFLTFWNVSKCIEMYQNELKLAFIAAYGEACDAKLASLAF